MSIDQERTGDGAARTSESTAKEATKQVASEAASQASDVVAQAKQELTGLVDQTKQEFQTQLETKGQQAAGGLRTVARQLSALSEGRPDEAGPFVGYVHEARARAQSLAQRLEQESPQQMFDDLGNFARRRPGAFLFGAAVLGFAAGRMARAGTAASHEGMVHHAAQRPAASAQLSEYTSTMIVTPPAPMVEQGDLTTRIAP